MRAVSAPPRPEARIEGAKRSLDGRSKTRASGAAPPSSANALALAWRIGVELVGAVLVASAIGWAIDRWLGTRPWGMIVMFFLGVAAGMLNVWRTVASMGLAGSAAPRRAAGDLSDDED